MEKYTAIKYINKDGNLEVYSNINSEDLMEIYIKYKLSQEENTNYPIFKFNLKNIEEIEQEIYNAISDIEVYYDKFTDTKNIKFQKTFLNADVLEYPYLRNGGYLDYLHRLNWDCNILRNMIFLGLEPVIDCY